MFSFRYWVIGALGSILSVCTINFIVDPMLFFRIPAEGKQVFYPESQRYQVPGIAKNYLFDGVIIGSSLSENFSTNQLKERLGINVVNLSISGSSAKEQAYILNLALIRGNVKHVFWLLNWESFAHGSEYISPDIGWPKNIYESPVLATFKYYLANGDMFKRSMKLLFSKKSIKQSDDMDTAWNWNKKFTFGCESVKHSVTMRKSNPIYEMAKKGLIKFSYSEISKSVNENLLRIIRDNPAIHFDLILPPFSKWAYINNNQIDEILLEANLHFREKIQNDIQNISNVSLYDYQTDPQIILNSNNYKDVIHFSQEISNQIIDDIAFFKVRPLISATELLNVVKRPGNCLN